MRGASPPILPALPTLIPAVAIAEFDPAKVYREPAAIAERYPDPDVRYPTPGFHEGRTGFPSHGEVLAYLDDLARSSPHVCVRARSCNG